MNTITHKALLFITGLIISFSLAAQDNSATTGTKYEPSAHFGLRGGINFSNFYKVGENVTDQDVKFGYNVGIFAKAPVVGIFSIQTELLLLSKGTSSTYEMGPPLLGPGNGQLDFNLNYLELPVLAVFNLNRYINIHGGVYGAYLLSANTRNTSDNSNYNDYEELNKGDYNSFDYGLCAGAGLDLYPIVLGIRYDYGLRQIGLSDHAQYVTNDARNSCLQVYAGIAF